MDDRVDVSCGDEYLYHDFDDTNCTKVVKRIDHRYDKEFLFRLVVNKSCFTKEASRDALVALINTYPTLVTAIKFYGARRFSEYGSDVCKRVLNDCLSITCLEISHCRLKFNTAKALLMAVGDSAVLKSFSLWSTSMAPTALDTLGFMVQNNGSLERLSVRDENMSIKAVSALALALADNTRLTSLTLNDCSINSVRAEILLMEGLLSNTTLTFLDLKNNWLNNNNAGFEYYLSTTTTLERLDLTKCLLNNTSQQSIANGLARNTGLQVLSLTHNASSAHTAACLMNAVASHGSLTDLTFSMQALEQLPVEAVVNAIRRTKTLSRLIIDNASHTSNDKADRINEALRFNTTITTFMENCEYRERFMGYVRRNRHNKQRREPTLLSVMIERCSDHLHPK